MTIDGIPANLLPSPVETLLLKAALFRADAAIDAWTAWKAAAPAAPVTQTTRQLLPLVYANLSTQGVRDDRLALIRAAYLETWAVNRGIVADAAHALSQLERAGVPVLVFKGAALGPLYYRDAAARAMGDVDVLVRESAFADAAAALAAAGLVPRHPLDDDRRLRHAVNFDLADGRAVADLHWHLVAADCAPGSSRRFWDAAVPARIGGIDTQTLCRTDHLIVACVHGLIFSACRDVRWIADAVTLIGPEPGQVDWDRLVAIGVERGLTLQLSAGLRYVRETFDQPVPSDVLTRLEHAPTSASARMLARAMWSSTPFGGLPRHVYHWVLLAKAASPDGSASAIGPLADLVRHRFRRHGARHVSAWLATEAFRALRSSSRVLKFTFNHTSRS